MVVLYLLKIVIIMPVSYLMHLIFYIGQSTLYILILNVRYHSILPFLIVTLPSSLAGNLLIDENIQRLKVAGDIFMICLYIISIDLSPTIYTQYTCIHYSFY